MVKAVKTHDEKMKDAQKNMKVVKWDDIKLGSYKLVRFASSIQDLKIAEKNKQLNKTKNEELVAKILKLLVRIFDDLLEVDTQQILQQLVVKQDSSLLELVRGAQALYATLRDVDGEHKPMASGIMDVFCSMVTLLKISNFGFTVDGVVEKVAKMVDASGAQCKLFKGVRRHHAHHAG